MKKLISACLILGTLSFQIQGQILSEASTGEPPTVTEIVEAGEYLKYEAKYSFFKVGWMEVKAVRDTFVNGDTLLHLKTIIKSNSKVPFVGTEIDEFNSLVSLDEQGRTRTEVYWKDNLDEGEYREIEYFFNRETGEVAFKEEDGSRDTLDLKEPASAGQDIFFWGRLFAGTDSSYNMNVYVSKEMGSLVAENSTKKEKRKVIAFDDRKVDTYYSKGKANLDGPFGFSGDFEAWYLADDLRVPVEARFKVFLGKVKLRLVEYRRNGEEYGEN